jgi:hypothetical protein
MPEVQKEKLAVEETGNLPLKTTTVFKRKNIR